MLKLHEIESLLLQHGFSLSGPLAKHDGSSASVYAFIEIVRNSEGHQKPSNVQLNKARDELQAQGIEIAYILNDVSDSDLASGLRATLLQAFPDHVRNAFLSTLKQDAVVWVVPKATSTKTLMEEISSRVATYLENADLRLVEVRLTVDENLPTRTAILSELRVAAPATVEMLIERLSGKGFAEPPVDYINRHLDALRRSGQIVRRKDAHYCLTAQALKVLGTVKRESSPDIRRLLDLARRGDLH